MSDEAPWRRPRRVAPISLVVAVAAVPALLLAGAWQYAESNVPPPTTTTTTTAPPPPVDELTTDLLSFRRDPVPLADRVALAERDAQWTALADAYTVQIADGSCLRMVDDDGIVIADVDPSLASIPASNQKLLVAAVSLDVLGPDHTFRTEVVGPAPVDGTVAGDVYLVGSGDPVLVTADLPDPLRYPAINTTALEPLADQLAAAGITTIDGDVVGDGSRYDDEFRAPTWGDHITNFDAGPYDALLVNDGLISVENHGLEPSRSAARAYLDLVLARGVQVTGSAANAARPTDAELATLASIESRPLTDILVELLHTSDNNTAEMLLKEIGVAGAGSGTRQAGLDVIRSTLDGWGIPTDGLLLHDGSGLSRDNRVSCSTLSALIADSPVAETLVTLLPVAGRDGTLAEQFVGTVAEGELAAKTGTLTDVKALTGVQPARDGTAVDFSLVLNGEGVNDAEVFQPLWQQLSELIASYPIEVEPDVELFAPR